ncbi:redoxin domain-containing protein [Rathayibacter sp. KR2-224]|uniref:redoxin domain-containing protein n=1 Tax=Rathayibacter sp. KR2-224 TaxID=3400913 RepID=UPI003C0AD1EB
MTPDDSNRPPEDSAPTQRTNSRWLFVTAAITLVALLAGVITVAMLAPSTADGAQQNDYQGRPGINKPTADLLSMDTLASDGTVRAPEFDLTNEDGSPLTLARFKGDVIVLTFNDDQCADLCALFAQDVIAADHDLSAHARKHIAFVSINANPYYPSTTAVQTWTNQHGLAHLGNWYFGTGTPQQLATTAHDYGVNIQLDPATKSVAHGTEIFFIKPNGTDADIADFGTQDADTAPFSHGLAVLANDALPTSEQAHVTGKDLPAALPGGTEIGDTPAPVSGPTLGSGTGNAASAATATSSASDHGQYTVMDFWSSTCTACASQLDAAEAEHTELGNKVDFLGIDVNDSTTKGKAAIKEHHLTFPVLSDAKGTQAARFQASDLPYTVILSPTGKILVRHPGVFTQEELDYVLRTIDNKLPMPTD